MAVSVKKKFQKTCKENRKVILLRFHSKFNSLELRIKELKRDKKKEKINNKREEIGNK